MYKLSEAKYVAAKRSINEAEERFVLRVPERDDKSFGDFYDVVTPFDLVTWYPKHDPSDLLDCYVDGKWSA